MQGLTAAEAESRAAYLGAIRALAAALDARDPYTAGHSERVSALSVLIGREMNLSDSDLDVLRLGALLHDIGKIGLSDAVLRKASGLTTDEYEQIKRHPALGARILRQVPFLAPHLPIVELHHERPDGRGYPFGLRGDDIPLAARIVHVADAFDAMTSARAYRPARATLRSRRRAPAPRRARSSIRCRSRRCSRRCLRQAMLRSPSFRNCLGGSWSDMRQLACVCLVVLAASTPALAQQARPSRFAIDTSASIDGPTKDANGNYTTGDLVDGVMSADLGRGFQAIVRPWAQRNASTPGMEPSALGGGRSLRADRARRRSGSTAV